jgi:hypothetical protein
MIYALILIWLMSYLIIYDKGKKSTYREFFELIDFIESQENIPKEIYNIPAVWHTKFKYRIHELSEKYDSRPRSDL